MRALSWWISWRDLEIGSESIRDDIRRRADAFVAANADTVIVFGAHFRWDFLPYWDILHWYLRRVSEALHERGVKLYDHHSATLVHRCDFPGELRKLMFTFMHHLPLVPSRQAADTWEFNGQKLNSWRMIDARTGKAARVPCYSAEQFCFSNPGFRQSYLLYLKKLVSETGVDGLMCDDLLFFGGFRHCGCPFCRARLDFELPSADDYRFWGNWGDVRWRTYLRERRRATGDFISFVRNALPGGFPLMSCCTSGCYGGNNYTAQSVHEFARGDDLINLEICGSEPGDTCGCLTDCSYQAGAGKKYKLPVLSIGYGFYPDSAGHLWALNRFWKNSTWFSALNGRLGLTREQLDLLPGDALPATGVFTFEKQHPELFTGETVGFCAVYFSENTKTETYFGACENGATGDYRKVMKALIKEGITPETVFDFPTDVRRISCVVMPSVIFMTEEEEKAMNNFLGSGGTVLRFGPRSAANLPTAPKRDFDELNWLREECFELPEQDLWMEEKERYFYNSSRTPSGLKELILRFGRRLPAVEAPGFAVSYQGKTIHLLALEYRIVPHPLERARRQSASVALIEKAFAVNCARHIFCSAPVGNVHCPVGGNAKVVGNEIFLSNDPMYVIIELEQENDA